MIGGPRNEEARQKCGLLQLRCSGFSGGEERFVNLSFSGWLNWACRPLSHRTLIPSHLSRNDSIQPSSGRKTSLGKAEKPMKTADFKGTPIRWTLWQTRRRAARTRSAPLGCPPMSRKKSLPAFRNHATLNAVGQPRGRADTPGSTASSLMKHGQQVTEFGVPRLPRKEVIEEARSSGGLLRFLRHLGSHRCKHLWCDHPPTHSSKNRCK